MAQMAKPLPRPKKYNRQTPYSLPASSFYFLVAGLALATFFLVILVFHDGGDDFEWVTAGLASSGVLIVGVVLREVVLRNARERHIARRRMLDRNLRAIPVPSGEYPISGKFTLEQNATALETIRTKSEAAKVFGRIAAGHKEVFELCAEYRRIIAKEIPNVHPDSPRLKAMMLGNKAAAELQEFHLLRWAKIESKEFAAKAENSTSADESAMHRQKAKGVIDLALSYYPENKELLASADFLSNIDEPNDRRPS